MPRITMEDVAKRAGVSRALVSLAYRDRPGVSAATRRRILDAGDALGYSPDQVAARLASRGGTTIGVFLQDLHNDLFADFHDGIREIASAAQKELVLAVGDIDGSRDRSALETLRQSRVDVIIAGGLQFPDAELIDTAAHVPIICVFRRVPGIDCVVSDDRAGARAATEHLLALGHRRIAYLASPHSEGYLERQAGYRDAMVHAECAVRVVEASYSRSTVAEIAGAMFDVGDPPSAVFAHNDQAALGVLDAMAMRGLRPGTDVSVVGYDNSAAGRLPGAPITTVDVDGRALGRSAAELAVQRMGDPQGAREVRTFEPKLLVRGSTTPLT